MMLRSGFSDRGNMDRVLIFTRTKHGADRVVKLLAGNGIAANAIHGNKSQPQRERALAEFKSGKVKIMIATDIAARGIDVSGVSHVINFELPNVPEQYVHRIGRTARAGAAGIAIGYCAEDERPYLKSIEKLTKQRIEVVPLPENFLKEADRIKNSRTGPPVVEREERPRGPARPAKRYSARPARPGNGGGAGQKRNAQRRRAPAHA
jgi:ATP-dependent RNA helicase RhlE